MSPPRPSPSDFRAQLPLGEYPVEMMRVSCRQCDRKGRVSKARLIAEWGPGIGLVDLLQVIAADCPEMAADFQDISRCGIRYDDLSPS